MGYGIVLGGGGAKGAYEIGVWKALKEMDIPIDVVVGTSVGALNGAIMVQGDYEKAVQLWSNLKMTDVIHFELDMENRKPSTATLANMARMIRSSIANGGMDVTPLKELLNDIIDEGRIRASKVDFGIVTFSLSDFKPVRLFKNDIPEGMLAEYLLASACFPTFKPQVIDDKRFIDGGVYDNIPISMVLEKCDSIIAIDVSGPGRIRKTDTSKHELINIKNSEYLGGTLNFDGTAAEMNIQCGYLDTLKAFGAVSGSRYYLKPDTGYRNYLDDEEIERLYAYMDITDNMSIGQKKLLNDYNYSLIKNRIFGTIREYSSQELDRSSLFMGMLEISAEFYGIERKAIYDIEDLVCRILDRGNQGMDVDASMAQRSAALHLPENWKIKIPASLHFADRVNRQAHQKLSKALLQPKQMIADLFLKMLQHRTR